MAEQRVFSEGSAVNITKRRGSRAGRKKQGKRGGLRRFRLKCHRLGLRNIRILYWNCASVKQRGSILETLVYRNDIVALQETRLGDQPLRIAGFKCFYNRRHLGTAILVRDSMVASELDMSSWDSDDIQIQALRVHSSVPFVLVNVYARNGSMDAQKWQCLSGILGHERNVIFCGDFNAKGRSWGNTSSNTQGEELETALETIDLVCINSGCVTRTASRPGDEDSAIDLALVSPLLTTVCRWGVLGHHGSDHRPCSILVEKGRTRQHKLKVKTFQYDSTGQDVDFQIYVFGFKFTPKDQHKPIADALVHFSNPGKEDLLFAYDFGHFCRLEENHVPLFMAKKDWERELERLQCQSLWRVAEANVDYQMSTSLPEYFVTPTNLLDTDLRKAAAQFADSRLPTWCYTYVNGASLVRMSQIQPESDFKTCENKLLDAIKQSSGNDKDLVTLDLNKMCPSLLDLRVSHEKLKSIIMTDSAKDFFSTDSRWLSNLENSQWLQHIALCLNTANHVVNLMVRDSQTVVIREESGCDMTCLMSSLVQIQLDPENRTIAGFQNLIQREWVVMGHPFQKRFHFVFSPDQAETEKAPVFLLFLDCVWQLLQQFPSSFAFTETYLTSLWDTVHVGLFETFLFNSCWHRQKYLKEGRKMTIIALPSAWDWKFQLTDEQVLLFNNPLYNLRESYNLDSVVDSAKNALRLSGEHHRETNYWVHLGSQPSVTDIFALQETVLKPEVTAGLIKLWSQCFLRWIVPAQIVGGGNPSQYMQQCILAEEIVCLQYKLQILTQQLEQSSPSKNGRHLQPRVRSPRPQSGLVFGSTGYQTRSTHLSLVYITSSFPFSPAVSQLTQHALIGKLSRYLQETEIDHDYAQDDDD